MPPGGELLESDPIITHVVYADSNLRKSVEALLKCYFDLIVSDTNYYGIEELIQYSGASGVVTNLWRQPPNQPVGDRFLDILLAENLIAADAIVATPCLYLTSVEQRRD